MKSFFDGILSVPASDPDDSRRRRVLNILLLGTFAATLVGLAGILIAGALSQVSDADFRLLLSGILGTTFGILGIYYINRRYSGRWAAMLFLLLLTAVFSISDTPEQ
jgi:hypothetical protein